MGTPAHIDLEELAIALYSALDDALTEAGVKCTNGKLIQRPGPAPDVDDREILCLAVLQELLGFESDHSYHHWLERNPIIDSLFDQQFHASRSLCRSRKHYIARRSAKAPSHNTARHINTVKELPRQSYLHFRLAA